MLADRMQEHASTKETFFPLPIPYHPHPLFFAKEPHPLFLFEIGLIHHIRILRRQGRME